MALLSLLQAGSEGMDALLCTEYEVREQTPWYMDMSTCTQGISEIILIWLAKKARALVRADGSADTLAAAHVALVLLLAAIRLARQSKLGGWWLVARASFLFSGGECYDGEQLPERRPHAEIAYVQAAYHTHSPRR
jgi:hypothetical protein